MHNAMADQCQAPIPEARSTMLPDNSSQFTKFCGMEFPFAQLRSLPLSFVYLISRALEKGKMSLTQDKQFLVKKKF